MHRSLLKNTEFISVNMPSGGRKLDLDNIFYIESEGHNLSLHTTGGDFTVRAKMSDYELQLSPYNFFRSNKGYLVNLKYVDGVESRTSSPVRITRGDDGQSTNIKGLFPCGEGAGYAGGIMSAAMDGIRIVEMVAISMN